MKPHLQFVVHSGNKFDYTSLEAIGMVIKVLGEDDSVIDSDYRDVESGPTPMEELHALTAVMEVLHEIGDSEAQARIIKAAASFLKLGGLTDVSLRGLVVPRVGQTVAGYQAISQTSSVSPKEFLLQKQPKTDVERVACLAFYLTHFRETPFFKTIDISKLNTEAAQPKFSNAAKSVDNATATRYLGLAHK